jgi:predicted PurR-regulated permease PerM
MLAVNGLAKQFVRLSKDFQETEAQLVDAATAFLNRVPPFLLNPMVAYLEEREEFARAVEGLVIEDVDAPPEEETPASSPLEPADSETKPLGRERVTYLVKLGVEKLSLSLRDQSQQILSWVGSSAKGIFSAFTAGIIVLFLTFFLLSGGRQIKKIFIQVVPNRFFEPTLVLIDELDHQLGNYMRSRMIQTLIISALCAIGYWIMGLHFAIALGIVAGLANLIPYIGPLIGAAPAIIAVFLGSRFGIGWTLLGVLGLTLFVQLIDNALITPLVIGKSVELGPIATIIVVLLGEKLLGLVGVLMAVPIAAMCKLIIAEAWEEFKGYSRSILQGH